LVNKVPHDLSIFADAGLLTRVFENSIANSINLAPRGSIVVEAFNHSPDGSVQCRITDSGPGIPQAKLADIFKNGDGPKGHEDVGLGLAIVKQFVEAHGGTIAADSTEGVGTTIRFTLPGRPGDAR
jgi:signal transduction histidine kinase